MREKVDILKSIALNNSSVWLLGESGTGKSLAAKFIHLKSTRKNGAFIAVNCACKNDSYVRDLIKSVTNSTFKGGCTLFMDEISLLEAGGQEELSVLLTLKEKLDLDLKIISSTRTDVEALAREGRFSSELYYKLSVFPVLIPPLRDRKEDILPLAVFFLEQFSLEIKKIFESFDEAAVRALQSARWTGNVRELKNRIERAVMLSFPPVLYKEALFGESFFDAAPAPAPDMDTSRDLKSAVSNFRKKFVIQVLEENNWNRTRAAEKLEIERTHLSRIIREAGITQGRGL